MPRTRKKTLKNQGSRAWKEMPNDLKNLMGTYLLKNDAINDASSTAQINQAICNRKNIDLPFIDREKDRVFLYTLAPWVMTYECMLSFIGNVDGLDDNNTCTRCLCGTGMCLCILPISTAASSIGFFVDCGRAAKRKYDNAKDEALYTDIIGPPHRVMK